MFDGSKYSLEVPTGMGLSLHLSIDAALASAEASSTDRESGGQGPITKELAAIADATLRTWFLDPVANQMLAGSRAYRAPRGWTKDGWRNAFEPALAETFQLRAPDILEPAYAAVESGEAALV